MGPRKVSLQWVPPQVFGGGTFAKRRSILTFKSPRMWGLRNYLQGKRGGGAFTREIKIRDPDLGRRGGGKTGGPLPLRPYRGNDGMTHDLT
jgi:hypothetical protein